MVNVIFLREYALSGRYEIITTPFPVPIVDVLVPRRLDYWHNGKFQVKITAYNKDLLNNNRESLLFYKSNVFFMYLPL